MVKNTDHPHQDWEPLFLGKQLNNLNNKIQLIRHRSQK